MSFQDIEKKVQGPTDTIDEKIADESEKESQRQLRADRHQRRTLRYGVCFAVVGLLAAELLAVFMIVVWQGRGHFKLEEWTFAFITNGVLIQTFLSLRTIIIHLFPNGERLEDKP